MKVKKKGRVHPSLSSSSSSPVSYGDPTSSVFRLLPVAILGLALPLPPQDQQVLAYMITRSIISSATTLSTGHLTHQHPKPNTKTKTKYCKKGKGSSSSSSSSVCGCFDCYTRFWHRWDCSPNRDLIHQVIEAFEDHLLQTDAVPVPVPNPNKQKPSGTARKKHYHCHQSNGGGGGVGVVSQSVIVDEQSQDSSRVALMAGENEPENGGRGFEEEVEEAVAGGGGNLEMEVVAAGAGGSGHKGLARKVLPDVVGLFNSRLWSLWGPTI